jgi:hypothetical protein
MTETATGSDMGVGLAMLFGAIALAGAGMMYLAADAQEIAAGGFAVAVLAGGLAVAALHVYGSD